MTDERNEEEEIKIDVGGIDLSAVMPFLFMNSMNSGTITINTREPDWKDIVLGSCDLISQADGPLLSESQEVVSEKNIEDIQQNLPLVTIDFILAQIFVDDSIPLVIYCQMTQDIIDYSDVYSWHEFNLGCITDIVHKILRKDTKPVISLSRSSLYTP